MISKHISNKEGWGSPTAIRYGINNKPNSEQLAKMKLVANNIFEPLRNHFNVPIKIESFFRSKKLNHKIGGSLYSQHMKGEAIDIDDDYGRINNADMFYYIVVNLPFDQLIWEFGNDINPGWIHVSHKECGNRKRISIAYKSYNRTYYKHFKDVYEFKAFKHKLYNS